MKKTLLFIAILAFGNTSFAQEGQDETMQKWMVHMTPGKMHKMLATYNGRWEAASKFWMAPGAEAMDSKGEMVTDMHLGDRFQKSTYTSEFMGMPFKGESTIGYDNTREIFVNTWIDNTSTHIMYSEGTWDEASKSIEFKGSATDPGAGGPAPFREVMTFIDDNTFKMEMYNTMDGKEFKSMEMTYTRKQ